MIEIRKMTAQDATQVRRILENWNMAPVEADDNIPDPERSTISVENGFVATDGDRVVGMCSYFLLEDGWAETASLAIDPAYVGAGLGYRLQHARLMEMREKGILWVKTEADRPRVVDWYVRKFGYEIVGHVQKRHAFSIAEIDEWTVLKLDLKKYAATFATENELD